MCLVMKGRATVGRVVRPQTQFPDPRSSALIRGKFPALLRVSAVSFLLFPSPALPITRDHSILSLFSGPPRLHASLDNAVTCELPSRKVRKFGCVFGAPFAPAFWREWAEQPNRTRGIGSAAAAGSKDTLSCSFG